MHWTLTLQCQRRSLNIQLCFQVVQLEKALELTCKECIQKTQLENSCPTMQANNFQLIKQSDLSFSFKIIKFVTFPAAFQHYKLAWENWQKKRSPLIKLKSTQKLIKCKSRPGQSRQQKQKQNQTTETTKQQQQQKRNNSNRKNALNDLRGNFHKQQQKQVREKGAVGRGK